MSNGLTKQQKNQYDTDGFTVLSGFFSGEVCGQYIEHMMELQSDRITMEGFAKRDSSDWGREVNMHFYDPRAMEFLLHPKILQPLVDCFDAKVDGVQTMYFYKGSHQRRHQDQFYLPGCMAAWIAMEDVGPHNGTIWVQKGSHRGHLVTPKEAGYEHGQQHPIGDDYSDAVDALFHRNARELGLTEIPIEVNKGDLVLFHGVLIHRGGSAEVPGSFRHVLANHYIPYDFEQWPYGEWPRYSFDGEKRAIRHDPMKSLPNRVTLDA